MTMQIELWALMTFLLGLVVTFITGAWAAGKVLLNQVEKRLEEKFRVLEEARRSGQDSWRKTFDAHIEEERREAEMLRALERDLFRLQADMPLQYVRREDYIRNQTIIEAKLDAVALKIENLQLRGMKSD